MSSSGVKKGSACLGWFWRDVHVLWATTTTNTKPPAMASHI
jgi:hypothetical protein